MQEFPKVSKLLLLVLERNVQRLRKKGIQHTSLSNYFVHGLLLSMYKKQPITHLYLSLYIYTQACSNGTVYWRNKTTISEWLNIIISKYPRRKLPQFCLVTSETVSIAGLVLSPMP